VRTVDQPGGTLNGIEQRVSHVLSGHRLRVGARVVLAD
jgi:hypothetical protein